MKDNYDLSQLTKKKKTRINSKNKGNTFERAVGKLFNERFNVKEFERSPNSGAYASTHNLPEHLKLYGDLVTPLRFRFTIECKKGYNSISLYSLINDSPMWRDLVEQSDKDSRKAKKPYILVLKQDHKPILATIKEFVEGIQCITITTKKDTLYMYLLSDLLKQPDSFWLTE
jgi:hypothetical protein